MKHFGLFLKHFFVLSPEMGSIFSLHGSIFRKFEKKFFFKNYFFSRKLYMWNQFPLIDTCLGIQTYDDEIRKKNFFEFVFGILYPGHF